MVVELKVERNIGEIRELVMRVEGDGIDEEGMIEEGRIVIIYQHTTFIWART